MRTFLVTVVAGAILVLPACQMNERMTGTAGGAGGGALLGGVLADSVGGALVGGAAGAVAGYIIGDYLADQRERNLRAAPAPQPSGSTTDAPSGRVKGTKARAPDPGLAAAWNAMGLDALRAGDRAKAAYCFRQALVADPSHSSARGNLASASRP